MNNYHEEATQNIAINEDGLGLFCTIPSEMDKNRRYELRCTESSNEVVVHSCTCKGFSCYKRCKHIGIVQAYWDRLYKPTPKVEAPVKKVRKPRNGLVRKVRNGGLVRVAQVAPVVAKIIELPVQPISSPTEDRMMKAALTTNKGFQLLR